jgi:hypothetical protein
VKSLAEANAMLEAQRAMLSGDDHVRREVAPWLDKTPSERLAAFAALCREGAVWLDRMTDEERARATAPDPLPEDALPILRALRSGR